MSTWKKGRGKLGFLEPLIGAWIAEVDSPMGKLRCQRSFARLGDKWIRLEARWEFDRGKPYQELALIGVGGDTKVGFWSFTSDGKRSTGTVTDVTDLHPEAIGFVAQMPAGTARMAYWPDGRDGVVWVVESKTAKGWRRFVEHRYRRLGD